VVGGQPVRAAGAEPDNDALAEESQAKADQQRLPGGSAGFPEATPARSRVSRHSSHLCQLEDKPFGLSEHAAEGAAQSPDTPKGR
jgi:hypothetical protein